MDAQALQRLRPAAGASSTCSSSLSPVAEEIVAADEMAFIDRLWADWSPGYDASEDLRRSRTAYASGPTCRPRSATTAPPSGAPAESCSASRRSSGRWPRRRRSRPCTCTGARDGCIGVDLVRDAEAQLSPGSRLSIVEGAGHFLHLDPKRSCRDPGLGLRAQARRLVLLPCGLPSHRVVRLGSSLLRDRITRSGSPMSTCSAPSSSSAGDGYCLVADVLPLFPAGLRTPTAGVRCIARSTEAWCSSAGTRRPRARRGRQRGLAAAALAGGLARHPSGSATFIFAP